MDFVESYREYDNFSQSNRTLCTLGPELFLAHRQRKREEGRRRNQKRRSRGRDERTATSMAPVCEALLAKLNELMDFLRFARLPSAAFRGAVRRHIVERSRTDWS